MAEEKTTQTVQQKPSKWAIAGNIMSGLGRAMSGVAAPFLGDYDWAQKQAALDAEHDFRQWQLQQQLKDDKLRELTAGAGLAEKGLALNKSSSGDYSIGVLPPDQLQAMATVKDLTMSPMDRALKESLIEQRKQVAALKEQKMSEDPALARRLERMGNDLDWNKNVRSAYGVTAQGFHRAERLEGLVTRYKDLNLDQRETEELAIGLNSMLQGANQSAQEQVKGLIPKSAWGNVQKMKEWLYNEPQGLQQQKFVERMLADVTREKNVMGAQLLRDAKQKLSKYQDLEENYPDEWSQVVQSWGIDPVAYQEWKKGGYKQNLDYSNLTGDTNSTPKEGKSITKEIALGFLKQSGGDKNKARELAKKAGFTF